MLKNTETTGVKTMIARYRERRALNWTISNSIRYAIGREPNYTHVDLSDIQPWES